jgi:hypothetical protein
MNAYTPGPWIFAEDHSTNACVYVRPLNNKLSEICTLYGPDDVSIRADGVWPDQPIRRANARLIAAAPDLLEALAELAEIVQGLLDGDDSQHSIDSFTLQPARAAITKATGA